VANQFDYRASMHGNKRHGN